MKKTLFINLKAFSHTGGLEKFNKCFLKALNEYKGKENNYSISAYDSMSDGQYYPQSNYMGYGGRLPLFVAMSVLKAAKYQQIIIGHINLAVVGCLIKMLYPKKEIILITHGIEVWLPVSGLKKKMLKKADKILAVSNFTKAKLVSVQQVSADKIRIFSNTIDPFFTLPVQFGDNDLRQKYGLKNTDFVLFTLARLSSKEQYKGYDAVIECLPELLKSIPDIKYIIAGKSDEQERQRVEAIVNRLHLADNIILAGYIEDDELTAHYQMSDLFIMPSKGEGFGIVFLEAMACGLPVLAGNKDGSVDALQNGKLGILVDPDNHTEIAQQISKFYDNRNYISGNSRQQLQQSVIKAFGFNVFKERMKAVLN